MNFDVNSTILISCGLGMTDYLAVELEQLGYELEDALDTALAVEGTLLDAMLLNLHLRTAQNVLYLLKSFRCENGDDLYKQVNKLDWEDIISPNEYICIVSRVDNPTVNNSMFPNLKVKDAVVDRIMDKTGRRPDSGPDKRNAVIFLYWKNDQALLYLNTSGVKISDRNYRKIPHTAPLRESLAAAIIIATGYDGSQPLVAPMCGSGTLAIEAALIATGRAPGLLRSNYGFMHLEGFDPELWKTMRIKARKAPGKSTPAPIIATDIDEKAVDAARKNAMTAGVEHLIDFSVCDFADTPIPPEPGIVIMNPEYGQRMGEIDQLEITYKRIGDFFKQSCPGYKACIFTGNLQLAKKVGLRTSRRLTFYNADIECRLLQYEMYSGAGS